MTRQRPIPCEEALRLLAAFLDGELAATEGQLVQDHLARCRSCFSRVEFEKRLKQQLAQLGRSEVSPEFERRVRALIERFQIETERS
ncbi:MAG: anti-sigma factor family protein [Gemmatimonadales bacterium]